ncbi:DUF2207 domain-containing protein [Terrisporobacter glycolicus]|nr:DUF2207 domain-containing protein [Terrisporobacter glycolicus]
MVRLKKMIIFLIFMAISINIFLFSAYAEDDGYYIKKMDVNVDVNDKREFKITETIDVYFNEERHGIIRSIPISTRLEDYNIKDVSVEGAPYEVEDSFDMKIRIGDEDETISGDKTYKITYTIVNYNEEKPEGDYIYFNVLGDQWDTKIENFTSTITYPKEANLEKINITDGEYGSKDSKNVQYKVKNNKIYINSINTIKPNNAITVNAMLNEGAFKNAPIKQYPYTMENQFININITDDKRYEIQRDFKIKINKNYSGEENRMIDLCDMIKGKNFYLLDMNVNDKNVSYDEKHGIITLDKSKDEYNFKVSYTIEPRLSDDIVFKIVETTLDGKLENLKVNIKSPFLINNAIVDFNEKGANYGTDRFNLEKNDNNVIFTNKNTIYDGEDVKLSLDIDKNLFVRPLPISANIVKFATPVILLIIVFLYFRFKDKNPVIPVVQFYPPRYMNSAEVAYGFNESISNSQVTSLLFYWASEGYIKIIMKENDKFTIEKLKEIGINNKPYEKNLFNSLFKYGNGKKVTGEKLKTYFGEEVSKAVKGVTEEFKYEKKLRDSASKKSGFMLSIISAIPIISCMMVAREVDHGSIVGGIIFCIILLVAHLVFYLIFYQSLKKRHGLIKKNNKIIGVIVISCIYLIIIRLPFLFSDLDEFIIMFSIVVSLIGNILSSCVPKRSDYGKELLGEIVGFRNFMEVAEKERLEALLEEDPEYFYNTLPYAQVLGVTKKWTDKFKDISMEQPSYYDTYYPLNNYIALNMFINNLNKVESTVSHTIDTSSGSSGGGFGGGGFSGGGSGGGGGSSW